MESRSLDTDVLVAGAGMAGLVAAVRATEDSVKVDVIEKAHRPGGSMYISNGSFNTYGSMEELVSEVPNGNRDLQQLLVENHDDALAWLAENGIEFTEPTTSSRLSGTAKVMDPVAFTDRMAEILEDRGATIHLETPLERLRTDDAGRVSGAVATTRDERVVFDAGSTVLATGGFQGNEYLVQQFITGKPDNLWLRSNPWSTGDGLQAAEDVNAKTTVGMGTFYGHNMIAPPAEFGPTEFTEATQYYGAEGIAVDTSGERYTDEAATSFEHTLAQDTAKLADGVAVLIIDRDIYDSSTETERHVGSMVKRARDMGGPVAEVDSLADLVEPLTEWGVNGVRAVRTIRSYNDTLHNGRIDELHPPRTANRNVIDSPPFYAIGVRPGITMTNGGLDVTRDGEVLRRSASSSSLNQKIEDVRDAKFTPIPGLYAAGADVGNVNNRQYLGGLDVALVTGLAAGESATEYAVNVC